MTQAPWRFRKVLFGAALAVLVALAPQAPTAEREIRNFNVKIDGRPAGYYRMTIDQRDDGTVVMEGHADVRVKALLARYTYTYHGTEVWKDGRLQQLKSTTNDDGKAFTVTARAEGNGIRVQTNGREQTTGADVWLTTYWRLPDAKYRNQTVPLIDADNGRYLTATLQSVNVESVTIAGQPHKCAHYRLTGGGLQVNLWYDSQERLVREESIEDGHRTLLELTRMGQ
jgi:hypothetical protein